MPGNPMKPTPLLRSGTTLVEVMIAMIVLVSVVDALSNYFRARMMA